MTETIINGKSDNEFFKISPSAKKNAEDYIVKVRFQNGEVLNLETKAANVHAAYSQGLEMAYTIKADGEGWINPEVLSVDAHRN